MEVALRHRNWGRWGTEDQLGTINLIDAECVQRAAALVRRGRVISCGLPYDENGPQTGTFGRHNPVHLMLQDGGDAASGAQDHLPALRYSDDAIFMPLQCGTQWDALSHIFHEGVMYNGYPQELVNSHGATRNGIELMADKIVSRGLFFDMPAYHNLPWLDPGDGVSAESLDGYAERYGITPRAGDIVLVRTGAIAMARSRGTWGTYASGDAPGLDLSAAEWLCDHDIAAVATDTWGMEVRPNQTDQMFQPLHIVLIVNAGMTVGEIFDFETLAADCADDGVYECLFVAMPLAFTGAVGSPLNPVAIK
jgi:kynurenine formamidase